MVPTPHDDRPLGPVTREALEYIVAATDPGDGIDRERAEALLVEEGFGSTDAGEVIARLLNWGYCYSVEDEIFVTDRDELE